MHNADADSQNSTSRKVLCHRYTLTPSLQSLQPVSHQSPSPIEFNALPYHMLSVRFIYTEYGRSHFAVYLTMEYTRNRCYFNSGLGILDQVKGD